MNSFVKKCLSRSLAAALVLVMATACAESNPEATVKKLAEERLGTNVKVDSVVKTPYLGLYEIRSGNNILYTDPEVNYLFVGNILDAKSHKNFTKERVDELSKVAFSDLPLDLALKKVKGDGSRSIAVFSDPNCGYCKQFEKTLKQVDNITVYTFLYNVLSKDSDTKSRNIWCSADRNQAWETWMLEGKAPAAAPADCTPPNEKVLELGKSLRVTGTPTIIFKDGSRVPGAIDAKGLEEKLAAAK